MRASRFQRLSLGIITFALVAGGVVFAQKQFPSLCLNKEFPSEARVEKVIDGDTIVLDGGKRVRYLGINAPETMAWDGARWVPKTQICGEQAKEYNQKLVEGKKVVLEYDKKTKDNYNRILAYVWSDGILVNEELLKKGLALMDTRAPNVKYQKNFSDFQKEARNFRRGIWGTIDTHAVSAQEAFKLIGGVGVVHGKIISVNIGKERVYLHFGKNWKRDFTGIIYKESLNAFSLNAEGLSPYFWGREVNIYGFVKNHEGPAIIISAPSQIDILN